MLVLESYKSLEMDLQEVAMTRDSENFGRVGQASELTDRRETRNLRRNAPADQLMHAWSIEVAKDRKEPTINVSRQVEMCPPEVYIG